MLERVTYEKAIALKYPEQVVVVIARDAAGKYNPMAVGWTMIASGTPPILAVAINALAHTTSAIRGSGAFVVAFPSVGMAGDVLYYGTHSGRDEDKLAATGAATRPATEVDGVLLEEAVACFECVLEREVLVGDHVTFFGRVVAAHANLILAGQRLYSLGGGALGGVTPGAPVVRR